MIPWGFTTFSILPLKVAAQLLLRASGRAPLPCTTGFVLSGAAIAKGAFAPVGVLGGIWIGPGVLGELE